MNIYKVIQKQKHKQKERNIETKVLTERKKSIQVIQ